MLGRGVKQIREAVVAGEDRVNVREDDDDGEQRQNDDVDLLAEEHAENGVPVGITRSGDLLGFRGGVIHAGEELLLTEPKRIEVNCFFHVLHLALLEKEILGSTMLIRTSPRMTLVMERIA